MTDAAVVAIFQSVYNEMTTARSIVDLSLPPVASFPSFQEACEKITLIFKKVAFSPNSELPVSTTKSGGASDESIVKVFFYDFEVRERPQMIRSRVLHEATHALRAQVVLRCNTTVTTATKYQLSTPEKLQYRFRGRFFLDQDKFHSGYYLEHVLCGGVWVTFGPLGYLLDVRTNTVTPITDPKGVYFFAIREISGNNVNQDVHGTPRTFHCIEGNTTGDRTGANDVNLYVSASVITRNGGGCVRAL